MQLFKEDPRDDKRKSHCEGEKDGSAEKKKQIFMLLKVRRKKNLFSVLMDCYFSQCIL